MANYKRVLIKLSGEALSERSSDAIICNAKLESIAKQLLAISEKNVEVGVVIGAGNIWRGKDSNKIGLDRVQADYMGMIGTIMNALALQNKIEKLGKSRGAIVYSAIPCPTVAEDYIHRNVLNNLRKGRIVIFAGGTGSPLFTTDSAAALRASEINAEVILMAKNNVDGVYDKDPAKNKNAKKFDKLTFDQVIQKDLQVMDQTALTLCKENDIHIIVFNISESGNILKAFNGTAVCTKITK